MLNETPILPPSLNTRQVGKEGWWLVRRPSSQEQGWVPGSYLQPYTENNNMVPANNVAAVAEHENATAYVGEGLSLCFEFCILSFGGVILLSRCDRCSCIWRQSTISWSLTCFTTRITE